MLLWPFRDLPAEHEAFVAVNRLAAQRHCRCNAATSTSIPMIRPNRGGASTLSARQVYGIDVRELDRSDTA